MRRRSPKRGGRPAHAHGAPAHAAPASPGQAAPALGQAAPASDAPLPAVPAWRAALERSVARGGGGLMAIALLTGAGAGAGAIAFRYMILGVTYILPGTTTTARWGAPATRCSGWGAGS